MNKLLIGAVVVGFGIFGGLFVGYLQHEPEQPKQLTFGAFSPSGGGTYRLGQSIGTTDTSIKLSSFKEPVSNISYTMAYLNTATAYGTVDPQTTRSEFVSFTGITQNSDGTATLTGITRGLTRTPAGSLCTASTTLASSHPGQSIFILSDSPCLFAEYAVRQNNEWITGTWGFNSVPTTTSVCSTASQLCNKQYVDSLSITGAPTSTESTMGVVRLATHLQVGSSTASSTSGQPLVIPNKFATTSPGVMCSTGFLSCIVAAAQGSGKIVQSWLDLTQHFIFTSLFATSASTTNATTTAFAVTSDAVSLNGQDYRFPANDGTASSTVLATNGSGALTWVPPNMALLVSSTTAVALRAATSSIFAGQTHLRAVIFVAGISSASNTHINFNTDYAGNYGSKSFVDANDAATMFTADNGLQLNTTSTTSPQWITLDIYNVSATRKFIEWKLTGQSSGTLPPLIDWGSGIWNNTSAPITSITVGTHDTNTLTSGTFINVYGSSN